MKAARLDWSRGLAAAGLIAAGAWLLLALGDWRLLGHGVRVGTPDADIYHQTLLFHGGLQARAMVGIVLMELAAAVIGYGLVMRPIWGGKALAPPIWLWVAGVIPGSLLIIPVARVVTLLATNATAPWLIFAATLAAAGALLAATAARRGRAPSSSGIDWRSLGAVAAMLAAALVFEVEFDRFHVGGEAIMFFIRDVFSSPVYGLGTAGHWPLVSQHYDEGAFLYPVVYGLMTPGDSVGETLTAVYWVHFAVGRVAAASLLYVALRGLRLDRLTSLVTLLFFMGASLSLNPLSSRVLFDSLSPLGFALHVARFVIPVLPVLLVSAAANYEARATPAVLGVALLLGVGVSSLPINVVVVLLWAVAALGLAALSASAERAALPWRALCAAGIIVLLGLTGAYGHFGLHPVARVAILLAAAGLAGAVLCWSPLRDARLSQLIGPNPATRQAVVLASLLVGYGLGVVLLGNIGVHKLASLFGGLWPWASVAIIDRLPPSAVSPTHGLARSLLCETGFPWSARSLMDHCRSLPIFARTYGLAPVLMTLFAVWRLRAEPRAATLPRLTEALIFWGLALCLVALPVAFLLFDFIQGAGTHIGETFELWLRSRLIEPWFYSGCMFAAVLFFRDAGARARRWTQSAMLAAVAVYAFNPMLLPAQIVVNASYLADVLGR